ncbi:hypothetical protein B0G62_11748 [Paraburkholderia eburnea]|uniref:Transmembrane protein n=1 Tax=Paraburkholderia eburnea TaxID=1189126 RepID=A0A2S4LYZ1_9BURK|nr:hypothetical protein [Paraburkholderia eburnea]POR47674.1 hypothetical protein B0G62_11748 [Paraburkholderia eburnea]PRZ19176.1 hypothetical protein BX588_11748 [Paraburkholderia eburnea]
MNHTELGAGVATPLVATQHVRPREAVSWGAILAGAVGMAAFSLILLTLGTGLGLSSLSPWPGSGAHAKTFGAAVVIWIVVSQIMASGLGGYLAGRLRRHWPDISGDETHFRDTAHGFLAWALATLLMAGLLASAASGVGRTAAVAAAESGVHTAAGLGGVDRGNAQTAWQTWPMGYLIDGMLRPVDGAAAQVQTRPEQALASVAQKQEIARIFLNSLPSGSALSTEDAHYVSQAVARQTGLSAADAQARVTTTYTRLQDKMNALDTAARAAADEARKATIHATLWLFVSLLIGAFAASYMATVGGRLREF